MTARRHLRGTGTALAALLVAGLAAVAAPAAQAAPADGKPQPIDFAVVVDESGSIDAGEMADEKAAASLLAQGELNSESRATVIGFGSATRAGQSPVDEVCSLTELDAAGRQAVSACVDKLRSRASGEGDDTDLPAAIQQAVSRLAAAPGAQRPRIILLLTDGKLDVTDSPAYGEPAGRRNEVAQARLDDEVLPAAVREKVQVWPLGFGDSDKAALDAIAAGGYQSGCANLPSAKPRARQVSSSTEVRAQAQLAFAGARCASVSPGTEGRPPSELRVSIPPIATDGTIEVIKQDPAVRVAYVDPTGATVDPATGTNGSTFELSGQDSTVEALRITDPLPGTWRIKLSAPAGHDGKVASSSAIWQGVLRSSISLNPASPTAGERSVVEVQLLTRKGVKLSDPADLRGIRVGVRLTAGGTTGADVPLADNGAAPDRTASDGLFSGYLPIPADAVGTASVVGTMTAEGVTGDQRPYQTVITPTPAKVTATARLDHDTVYPGHQVRGTLVVNNTDSRPHALTLTLADLDPSQQLDIGPEAVQVPAGSQQPVDFTLAFGPGSPIGSSAGRIVVTDSTDGDRQLSSSFLGVTVEKEPSWPRRHWWELLVGLLLLIALAVAAVLRRRGEVARHNPAGLTLVAYHEGRTGGEHAITSSPPGAYGFSFAEDGRIERRSGGPRWLVRRDRPGSVALRAPGARRWQTARLDEAFEAERGVELVVRDGAGAADGEFEDSFSRGYSEEYAARSTAGRGAAPVGAVPPRGSSPARWPRRKSSAPEPDPQPEDAWTPTYNDDF